MYQHQLYDNISLKVFYLLLLTYSVHIYFFDHIALISLVKNEYNVVIPILQMHAIPILAKVHYS